MSTNVDSSKSINNRQVMCGFFFFIYLIFRLIIISSWLNQCLHNAQRYKCFLVHRDLKKKRSVLYVHIICIMYTRDLKYHKLKRVKNSVIQSTFLEFVKKKKWRSERLLNWQYIHTQFVYFFFYFQGYTELLNK